MNTLFLDSSTGSTGIAITRNGRVVAETLLDAPGRRQNSWLLPELDRLSASSGIPLDEIELFACSKGPGSFTGIRTGIATVQGLATATGRPAVGISSLAMLAMNLQHTEYPVCVMLDARKNEVYTAIYRVSDLPETASQEMAIKPEQLLLTIDTPTIFIGDGAIKYRELILSLIGDKAVFASGCHNTPRPSSGACLAEAIFMKGLFSSPEQLLPTYLRLSEAELSRQQNI